jgi:hypothetical protein
MEKGSRTAQLPEASPPVEGRDSQIRKYTLAIERLTTSIQRLYNVEKQPLDPLGLIGVDTRLRKIRCYTHSITELLLCHSMDELEKSELTKLRRSLIHREA